MYIIAMLIVIVAAAFLLRSLLFWTLPEVPEDVSTSTAAPRKVAHFYDPRTWAMFQTRPLISYRRDKKGRFRKMP